MRGRIERAGVCVSAELKVQNLVGADCRSRPILRVPTKFKVRSNPENMVLGVSVHPDNKEDKHDAPARTSFFGEKSRVRVLHVARVACVSLTTTSKQYVQSMYQLSYRSVLCAMRTVLVCTRG